MRYVPGFAYHIRDEYFSKVNDDKLLANKENGHYRPTYYGIEDKKTGLIWVIPLTSKYEKFENIYNNKVKRYGRCDTIVLGEYDGKKAAFLLQNMFPITDKYIDHVHTRNGQPVPVKKSIQDKINKSFKVVINLINKKHFNIVFTDVKKLERTMIDEVNDLRQHKENGQSLEEKIKHAIDKADKINSERKIRSPSINKKTMEK